MNPFRPTPLPLRSELDRSRRVRPPHVLFILVALIASGAWWWTEHGKLLADELVFQIETIHVYWTLVATEQEKLEWKIILGIAALLVVVLAWLAHRFAWRAFFPDLSRIDPIAHPGGRAERVGRLYRLRKFQDDHTERVYYRHYYKHANRLFPLFRFDRVDLGEPARIQSFGRAVIQCGRLERDSTRDPYERVAVPTSYGSAPIGSSFREHEVRDDQLRKTSIVGPGPGTNPEVMRKKWQSEPSINPFVEQRGRVLLQREEDEP